MKYTGSHWPFAEVNVCGWRGEGTVVTVMAVADQSSGTPRLPLTRCRHHHHHHHHRYYHYITTTTTHSSKVTTSTTTTTFSTTTTITTTTTNTNTNNNITSIKGYNLHHYHHRHHHKPPPQLHHHPPANQLASQPAVTPKSHKSSLILHPHSRKHSTLLLYFPVTTSTSTCTTAAVTFNHLYVKIIPAGAVITIIFTTPSSSNHDRSIKFPLFRGGQE
ncbi:hypothetical protein E2C01_044036 [Portunus trituberculatus]|uniref:Uncharacterized protein n=1 Tax=Portunus trituberculatus TaxID=210409 RepID=A0A5B7FYV8_PORTR|nr:hypothetical protein [Portunus trituberculatus]